MVLGTAGSKVQRERQRLHGGGITEQQQSVFQGFDDGTDRSINTRHRTRFLPKHYRILQLPVSNKFKRTG